MFDELVKLMPEGVFLESLTQVGLKVSLNGVAQSNERVAELYRNLTDRGEWLERPQLRRRLIKEVTEKGPTPQHPRRQKSAGPTSSSSTC